MKGRFENERMRQLIGYLCTLFQYAKTPKGLHDILDYLLAAGIFFLIITLVFVILNLVR